MWTRKGICQVVFKVFALKLMIFGSLYARIPLEELLLSSSEYNRTLYILYSIASAVIPVLIGIGLWMYAGELADLLLRDVADQEEIEEDDVVLKVPGSVDLERIAYSVVGLVTVLCSLFYSVWHVLADPLWKPKTMRNPDNWETTASLTAWVLIGVLGLLLMGYSRYLSNITNSDRTRNKDDEVDDAETP